MSPSSTTTFPSRPSLPISWADDEDDDFDFEAWKATADISAPTVESLQPLQLPQGEAEFSFITSFIVGESAPWAAAESHLPSVPHYSTAGWRCANGVLVWRATCDLLDVPAYPELSAWGKEKRVNYAANWGAWKAGSGWNCKYPVLFRKSRLQEMEICEEEEDVMEVTIPLHQIVSEDAHTEEPTPPSTAPNSTRIPDEGYYSDTSPPISPTLCASEEAFDTPMCMMQVGIASATTLVRKHQRYDSLEPVRNNVDIDLPCSDILAGTVEDGLLDPSPDLEYIDSNPGISTYISNAAATGWFIVSSLPWTTAAILTAGMVVGGAMHIARRG